MESGEIEDFMRSLGVPTHIAGGRAVMDAQSYGVLFRILFNSSVFSRPTSEYALDLLRQTEFRDGLRAQLPADLSVSSKFGSHYDPEDWESGVQLHDCGIVYASTGPYVLCVMTRSNVQSTRSARRARERDQPEGVPRFEAAMTSHGGVTTTGSNGQATTTLTPIQD